MMNLFLVSIIRLLLLCMKMKKLQNKFIDNVPFKCWGLRNQELMWVLILQGSTNVSFISIILSRLDQKNIP
jgi:hypothetical protein